jgi:chemotaxis protein methyltransferase WspC
MNRVEDQLRHSIGLDGATVGPNMIQRAVRQRMRNLGLRRLEDYELVLQCSPGEWHELVESVVVTETWFFRDPEIYPDFVRLVREEWLPAHTTGPVRLLSVPCASGEEPFSIAMALLDAGVPAQRFQIDAVDISTRALARAERGVYRKNSFRGKHLGFRDRYFAHSKEGFVLDPAVRNCARFFQGNFLSDDVLTSRDCYQFIFCRNLLIYFDGIMRRKALDKLERLLVPQGILCVSQVEQLLALEHGFAAVGNPPGSLCRKALPGAHRRQAVWTPKRPTLASRPRPAAVSQTTLKPNGTRMLSPSSKPSISRDTDLDTARRLADAGRVKEAAEICEAHLRETKDSAQAYYLLGLVRDASGEAGAIDCYRKALYLEPNHYESLLQMALLLEKSGEVARARVFKNRAQRVRTKI